MFTGRRWFIYFIFAGVICSSVIYVLFHFTNTTIPIYTSLNMDYRRRPECTCSRHQLPPLTLELTPNQTTQQGSLCSSYATRRGPHQRIIAISLFGPKENKMFQYNQSITFLYQLIEDLNIIYSDGFLLRVYHDDTINISDIICPIECRNPNVDFCSMQSKLFIPPKIWRFTPAGDPLVDLMMSRDLDSPFSKRERAAVDAWIASNKSFHAMRDHPYHGVPMLGGMWGFRPSLDRTMSLTMHNKIHNRDLMTHYGGRLDQSFLAQEVWPQAKSSVIAHDSFICNTNYGQKSVAFPTERPPANDTNCFVGCVRPCCSPGKRAFGECPKECRPPDHPEWAYC